MTHEHTAHTGPGLESTPHTDEHLYALTTHFSPLSLALIGPDLAQELVACRDTLQTVIRCSDTYTERYLNQLTAPNGNIARLFKASPSTADLCHKMAEDLNEFTALRDKSPDQNARAVSDSARRHGNYQLLFGARYGCYEPALLQCGRCLQGVRRAASCRNTSYPLSVSCCRQRYCLFDSGRRL